jgi:hypothetical protein
VGSCGSWTGGNSSEERLEDESSSAVDAVSESKLSHVFLALGLDVMTLNFAFLFLEMMLPMLLSSGTVLFLLRHDLLLDGLVAVPPVF